MSEKKIKNPINIKREAWHADILSVSRNIVCAHGMPIRGAYYNYLKISGSSCRRRFLYLFRMSVLGFRICLKRK